MRTDVLLLPVRPVCLGPVRQACYHAAGNACRKRIAGALLAVRGYECFPVGLAQPDLIAAWLIGAPAKRLVFRAAPQLAFEIAGQSAFIDLKNQTVLQRPWDLGVNIPRLANLDS